jgi:hypothetical protein
LGWRLDHAYLRGRSCWWLYLQSIPSYCKLTWGITRIYELVPRATPSTCWFPPMHFAATISFGQVKWLASRTGVSFANICLECWGGHYVAHGFALNPEPKPPHMLKRSSSLTLLNSCPISITLAWISGWVVGDTKWW